MSCSSAIDCIPPRQQFQTGTFTSSMVPQVKGSIVLIYMEDTSVSARFVYTGSYMNGLMREITLNKAKF